MLPKSEVKAMLIADLENKKTKFEFFHDGMTCPSCGFPVNSGDPLYIIGGKKCCKDCKNAIITIVKEHL